MAEKYKSRARFIDQIKKVIKVDGLPAHGEWLTDDGEIIMNLDHGILHSVGDKAAVRAAGYHLEWYNHGILHRDGGKPAIIAEGGDIYEYWINGVFQYVEYIDD